MTYQLDMKLSFIILLSDFLLSFFLGAVIVRLVAQIAYQRSIFDIPDERKIHHVPVPRLGGVAFLPTMVIIIAFCIATLYRYNLVRHQFTENVVFVRLLYMTGSAMILYIVGLADDLIGLGYKTKFLFQFFAAAVIISSGIWINNLYGVFGINEISPWIGIPLSMLVIIFVSNAINLIDGIDGLASGIVIISLTCLSIIFVYERQFSLAMTSLSALGAVSAFWIFNVFGSPETKTKIYMGDAGSLTLGLILCFLILSLGTFEGHNGLTRNCKYFIIAFSSLMIPLLDVVRLIIFRLKHHKNPFQADMNHVHHKLIQLGATPRQALVTLLLVDVILVLGNAFFSMYVNVNLLLVLDVLLYYLAMLFLTDRIEKEKKLYGGA